MNSSKQSRAHNSSYLFVANWKMYFSYNTAFSWATTYCKEIAQIIKDKNISFIICPSYDALASVAPAITKENLFLGAQNCSSNEHGAYTGQVSVTSLQEIGCTYALVGHSETRFYEHLENSDLITKITLLRKHNITPIVCIGDTKEEYENQKSIETIHKQLEPLLPLFQNTQNTIYIAYEPLWAIGAHTVPSKEHLEKICTAISQMFKNVTTPCPTLIYGGSVDEISIQDILKVTQIQGVLVGRASTDFQKIKTIVSLVGKRSLRTQV